MPPGSTERRTWAPAPVSTCTSTPGAPTGPNGSCGTSAQASAVAGSSVTTRRNGLPHYSTPASSTSTVLSPEGTTSTLALHVAADGPATADEIGTGHS